LGGRGEVEEVAGRKEDGNGGGDGDSAGGSGDEETEDTMYADDAYSGTSKLFDTDSEYVLEVFGPAIKSSYIPKRVWRASRALSSEVMHSDRRVSHSQ